MIPLAMLNIVSHCSRVLCDGRQDTKGLFLQLNQCPETRCNKTLEFVAYVWCQAGYDDGVEKPSKLCERVGDSEGHSLVLTRHVWVVEVETP